MKPKEKKITLEWLRENVAYEPQTGTFLWKKCGYGRVHGRAMGTKVWPGYRSLRLNGNLYYAHRVAWFYTYGEWPDGFIDHIDGNKGNNSIANLRIATPAQNSARRKTIRTLAPSRGVFPHGSGFVARIHHAGKRHYLGYFPTAAAAKAAYEAKAKEIHGDFAFEEAMTEQDASVAEAMKRNPNRDWLIVATPGFGA